MTIKEQQGYVLQSRPYRNTSLLIEIFTLQQGRVAVIAKGARRARSPMQGVLQVFQPLWLTYSGQSDLQQLQKAEAKQVAFSLRGEAVYAGWYINELILRCCLPHDAHPELFHAYEQCLQALAEQQVWQSALRCFELDLLQACGFAIPLSHDAHTGEVIEADGFYHFSWQQGVCRIAEQNPHAFSGQVLLAMAKRDFSERDTLQAAKRLTRLALNDILGDKPLRSRELLRSLYQFKEACI